MRTLTRRRRWNRVGLGWRPLWAALVVSGLAASDLVADGRDPQFVREREELLTRGYRRLLELAKVDLPIVDYPLPEFRHRA